MDMETKKKLSPFQITLIKIGVIAVVVIALVLTIFLKGYFNATDKYKETIAELEAEVDRLSEEIAVYYDQSREVSLNVIEAEIKSIGELATLEYRYTDAGKFEDPKELFGVNIPFTTKSFIAKWDGVIKAGIDIEQVIVEVDESSKEIIISLPPAKILSHEIDSESIETLDEKNGLFNPVTVSDVRDFDAVSKSAMEERVIEMGLLEDAQENAEQIIQMLILNDVVQSQNYTIRFQIVK